MRFERVGDDGFFMGLAGWLAYLSIRTYLSLSLVDPSRQGRLFPQHAVSMSFHAFDVVLSAL